MPATTLDRFVDAIGITAMVALAGSLSLGVAAYLACRLLGI